MAPLAMRFEDFVHNNLQSFQSRRNAHKQAQRDYQFARDLGIRLTCFAPPMSCHLIMDSTFRSQLEFIQVQHQHFSFRVEMLLTIILRLTIINML